MNIDEHMQKAQQIIDETRTTGIYMITKTIGSFPTITIPVDTFTRYEYLVDVIGRKGSIEIAAQKYGENHDYQSLRKVDLAFLIAEYPTTTETR